MAQTKLYGKDLKEYLDLDLDELFAQLSEEDIIKLGQELIDPDDPMIPPSERCAYKTDKGPTGPFDRKALLDFLEKKAKEEKDWEEVKPFVKEIRGKVYMPKEAEKIQINDDEDIETEWDEVLKQATEEELVDLAAILGFHGMLNQVQYHQAFVEKKDQGDKVGGFSGYSGIAKPENLKVFEKEEPNTTDVEESIEKVKSNDKELKELNLNNIKNISLEQMKRLAEALVDNTNLETLHLSNTRCTDRMAKGFADALKENNTLKVLNMESNYISGKMILELLEAINKNKTLEEFRITNQRPAILGHRVEQKIADLVEQNMNLKKFGICLEVKGARVRLTEYMQRNNDTARKDRVGKSGDEV